jgi:hypothetical protein
MKRNLYLLIGLGVIVVLALLVLGSNRRRRPEERITLRREDKIPYGFFAARALLPGIFPGTAIFNDRQPPGQWDSIDTDADRQAVVLVGRNISADNDDMETLLDFAEKGNFIYCIAPDFSSELCDRLRLYNGSFTSGNPNDSLVVNLAPPRFAPRRFHYPGRPVDTYFTLRAADSTVVLGTNERGRPNFVQFRVGKGAVFLHGAPLAFSNYFLLQPGNETYFASVFSVLPADLRRIVWNEYYLTRPDKNDKEPNWLGVLFRYEAFRWALLVALATLLLYALSEMRRRQRAIPPFAAPKNESLDFVKTVGRLYYDKRDHHNLALKMSQYFLESVRHHYKMNTTVLDSDFVQRLEARSGYPRERLQTLVDLIVGIRNHGTTSATELQELHRQLEAYYQTI